MSARLHHDDSWPRASALPAAPVSTAPAPSLRLVQSERPVSRRSALQFASSLRFAAWTTAVCLLTVGPGALPWEWCRIGGEALIAALFVERLIGSLANGTLSQLFTLRGAWNKIALGWLVVTCAAASWSYTTGWGAHSPYPATLYNGGWSGPLRQLADTVIAVMGYYAASSFEQEPEPSVFRRAAPILAAAAAVLALCIVEAVRNAVVGTSDPRLEATLTNPNLLGAFLCIALPISGGIAFDNQSSRSERCSAGVLAAGLSAALWLSGSRGALLGCMAGISFLGAYRLALKIKRALAKDPTTRLRLVPAASACLLLACLPALTRLPMHLAASVGAHEASDDQRRVAWRGAMLIIHQHPVTGLGLGSYPAAFGALRLFQTNPATQSGLPLLPAMHLHAHNLTLEFWAERGLPGLLLVSFVIGVTLVAVFRVLKRADSTPGDTLRAIACAALLATLTQNIADYTLWYAPLLILFWQLPALMTTGKTADNR